MKSQSDVKHGLRAISPMISPRGAHVTFRVPGWCIGLVLCLTLLSTTVAHATPLKQALVRRAINDVYIYPDLEQDVKPQPAVAGKDVIKGDMALRTGRDSRSELVFNDKSIARIGSLSLFSFVGGGRHLDLAKGVVVLQVKKNSKTTTVRTAGATAAVTGTTVLIEHLPGRLVKTIVLEGSMTVSLRDRVGESVVLTKGKMLAFPPDAQRLPDPVTIDVGYLVKTSRLLGGFNGTSKSPKNKKPAFKTGRIENVAREQNRRKKQGQLQETKRMIEGNRLGGPSRASNNRGRGVSGAPGFQLMDLVDQNVEGSSVHLRSEIHKLVPNNPSRGSRKGQGKRRGNGR